MWNPRLESPQKYQAKGYTQIRFQLVRGEPTSDTLTTIIFT